MTRKLVLSRAVAGWQIRQDWVNNKNSLDSLLPIIDLVIMSNIGSIITVIMGPLLL